MATAFVDRPSRSRQKFWVLCAYLILLVGLITVAVNGGTFEQRDDGMKDCARLVARYELMRHHWKTLETDREFRPTIDAIWDDSALDSVEPRWNVKFIRIDDPNVSLDRFETKAIEQIKAGKDEVWKSSRQDGPRYVRAVRAAASCIACHLKRADDQPTVPNDIIGFATLKRVPDRTQP